MIYTARQIEDLHKSNGHVRLPVGSRVTPLAGDWLRSRKIAVAYGEATPASARVEEAAAMQPAGGTILWWCDGPCGQAKAALSAQARVTDLQPIAVTHETRNIVAAVKHLASEIKAGRAAAGILVVQTGAAAVVYANRCPSLRAIMGTCRDAVQQGVSLMAANVLVIEHPYQSLQQVRNLLAVFVRGQHEVSDDVKRQLQELASCG